MQRLLLSSLIAVGLVATAMSAEAGGYKHRGKGYGGSGHYGKYYRQGRHARYRYHGHHNDDKFYTALGITAGIGLLGAILLSPPRNVAPASTYYAPPRRECYEQNVYRYLPDGRIQWGVKTTCY